MPQRVDQSRVLMALVAVIDRYWVTRGAVHGVPISGARQGQVMGQRTCSASLSGGADRSEPHEASLATARRGRCVPGTPPVGAGWPGCTQGGRGQVRALHGLGRVHIWGVHGRKARPGQGRGQCRYSARTSTRTVPEQS